ncbi:type III-B CRISPR-associated protein Cas10/Cmr2 [Nitrosomonas sp.]|uniref:type III-B CRISPR-associated protein Cas10/Cmr2 n=1 Tax=Nitrosomonas sp. TaxID=42353 RepID=UPI00208BDB75|nr:type III-B CRISPR-associated protein Cas10/Cmr2 [Nitrosomonas sp.]GJL75017.1 MAG: hypothetical protein NMNS02_11230 [Nitrosomonas sp.]
MKYFHFTLGPVQGFVSQARRTRDFWGGSFLLSWLSAVAMKSVRVQTNNDPGCILFPKADPKFLDFLSLEKQVNGSEPTQGSVPNRFKAEVADDFEPLLAIKDIQSAWTALADLIFERDLKDSANEETRKIWARQIEQFWDISWVLTDRDGDEDSSALDRRKNWRSYMPPDEAGVKCMMMEGWQELSGVERPNRKELAAFWDPIQSGMKTDLREHEYLCAMAFVKRRFVRYFHELKNFNMPGGWQLSGWKLPGSVPSVAYMAGVHWLEQAIEQADQSVFQTYFDAASKLTEQTEWESRITCLQRLREIMPEDFKRWTSLDGNAFHPFVLDNVNTFPDQTKAQLARQALQKLNDHIKQECPEFTHAAPFYAVLMMDGDSLGKHMGEKENQEKISDALKNFTNRVQFYIEKHSGFLIYAGGDDVLALLPLEDALQCAADLRMHYLACFKGTSIPTTLSGAIEFAHLKIPLTKVLYDVHHLLDDIAKNKTGRDSIAVRVQKPGGVAIEWSLPWELAIYHDPLSGCLVKINVLAEQFRQENKVDEGFSGKFFYKIRERFSILNPVRDGTGNIQHDSLLDSGKAEDVDLMYMEYLNSRKSSALSAAELRAKIEALLDQCRIRKRVDGEIKMDSQSELFADGALLVRFLAQKGIER